MVTVVGVKSRPYPGRSRTLRIRSNDFDISPKVPIASLVLLTLFTILSVHHHAMLKSRTVESGSDKDKGNKRRMYVGCNKVRNREM